MNRVDVSKARVIQRFDALLKLLSEKKELTIEEIMREFQTSKPIAEGWIRYIIALQDKDKLIYLNNCLSTDKSHIEKNRIECFRLNNPIRKPKKEAKF